MFFNTLIIFKEIDAAFDKSLCINLPLLGGRASRRVEGPLSPKCFLKCLILILGDFLTFRFVFVKIVDIL